VFRIRAVDLVEAHDIDQLAHTGAEQEPIDDHDSPVPSAFASFVEGRCCYAEQQTVCGADQYRCCLDKTLRVARRHFSYSLNL